MEYKVNGKTYTAPDVIDFGEIVKLEKCGLSLETMGDLNEHALQGIEACVRYLGNYTKEEANKEIMEHLAKYPLQDLVKVLEIVTTSDFFKTMVTATKNQA